MEIIQVLNLEITDLPAYIIWYIQQFIDNVDRVMMLLTSKTWYLNRDYILRFANMDKMNYHIKFEKLRLFQIKRNQNDFDFLYLDRLLDEEVKVQDDVFPLSVFDVLEQPSYSVKEEETASIQSNDESNQPKILIFTVDCSEHLSKIPKEVETLIFGKKFNSKLRNIPNTVKHISFGKCFSQQLQLGTLPPNLKTLSFDKKYNQPITKGALPASLEHLEFGQEFTQRFTENVLPPNLKSLKVGNFYKHSLNNVLPPSIERVELGTYYVDAFNFGNLPNLKFLSFHRFVDSKNPNLQIGELPTTLEEVEINFYTNEMKPYGLVEKPFQCYQLLRQQLPNTKISINYKSKKLEIKNTSDKHLYLLYDDRQGGFIRSHDLVKFLK
ncbi:hypothetical protein PPL_09134 [Heterostelium album PN500]|uniref:FNIP repeat-containing protein n=1 Tax=Heterostelium pallidum (strain ATCC 26659 / Pp 5 / PN500) TaxID=670386 RepID=D3BKQ2_HETP5|nr:hypothetical protein PPL_09134 [Heterostelium album PN500]EFA78482.1 hypothetical protein PPL_09134 [Heterostelium album PN500]|eukprot:XP_020430606.1 hypothetical protein PPL_09134 [Heterostelium album PN500]